MLFAMRFHAKTTKGNAKNADASLFALLANPSAFFASLRRSGLRAVRRETFPSLITAKRQMAY
jgi:tetraacyldisaccharide-1-P 4'-kinase